MKKKEHIALAVLGLTAVGFGVSLPFAQTFAGGLCAAASLAGLIGGLADWFAVNAIFGRPLGISFKTDLIVKNRDRLADGIGKMVGEELLAAQSVESFLAKRDLATMAVVFFDRMDGKRYLRQYLAQVADRVLAQVDREAIAKMVADTVRGVLHSSDWRETMRMAVGEMSCQGRADKAGQALLAELRRIVGEDAVYTLLVAIATEAISSYERDSAGRQFVHHMIDLSPERCARMVQDKVADYLRQEEEAGRGAYWLKRGLGLAIDSVDDTVIASVADHVERCVKNWLSEMREEVHTSPQEVAWLSAVVRYIEDEIDALILDREKNEAFNHRVRKAICGFLAVHQEELSSLASRGVARLSDEELTGFLRAKVGHDLQMIRVNGSLVGALVGAGLYLLRYVCKAVMV